MMGKALSGDPAGGQILLKMLSDSRKCLDNPVYDISEENYRSYLSALIYEMTV